MGEYRGAAHSIGNLNYNIPKKIPIVFHNGSNYDYHFLIRKLAKKSEKHLIFSRKIPKKYNLFSSNRKISYKN